MRVHGYVRLAGRISLPWKIHTHPITLSKETRLTTRNHPPHNHLLPTLPGPLPTQAGRELFSHRCDLLSTTTIIQYLPCTIGAADIKSMKTGYRRREDTPRRVRGRACRTGLEAVIGSTTPLKSVLLAGLSGCYHCLSPGPHGKNRPKAYEVFAQQYHGGVGIVMENAATHDHAWVIPLLLKHGARASSPRGIRALERAAGAGHEEVVSLLAMRMHSHRGRKLSGTLITAADKGYEWIVRILLKRGAVMPANPSSPSAKHLAAKEGHETILKLLIANDPEDYFVEPRVSPGTGNSRQTTRQNAWLDSQKWCCLHFAVYGGHYNIVKFLLDKCIKPRNDSENYATASPLAVRYGQAISSRKDSTFQRNFKGRLR